MQKVNINIPILDYNLYPRNSVDSQHASYMVESLCAGIELPPIVVDKTSKRIVDGFHRKYAWTRFYSQYQKQEKDMTIPVIFKTYKSDQDIFRDAMKYNSSHGRMLTQYDRTHCIIVAEQLGLSIDVTCEALSITPTKYDELKVERIGTMHLSPHLKKRKKGQFFAKSSGILIPLKRTIRHMGGKELTNFQVEANKKLSGMDQSFYANQLIELIEKDLLDIKNEYLMKRLDHLNSLLIGLFEKSKVM